MSRKFKQNQWGWLLHIIGLCSLLLSLNQSVKAHEGVDIGPYDVVVGWLEEPAIIGERNAITIEIMEDGTPITGVEAALNAELQYGGRAFHANLNPTVEPGHYTVEVLPTVRGQYTLHLIGSIEDESVDETVEPEEVFSADRLQFPETQPDPLALQEDIENLTTELESARTLAYIGIGVGVLGIVLAAVSLVRRRS